LLVALPIEVREVRNLNRREALEVNAGFDGLEAAQQVRVVTERQVGVQPVDDVDFGQWLVGSGTELGVDLLEGHRVRAGVTGPEPGERAEQARGFADVGRLEPQVVIEECARAVAPLALAIGEPAQREQVRRLEQAHAVVERQALARFDLSGDAVESG